MMKVFKRSPESAGKWYENFAAPVWEEAVFTGALFLFHAGTIGFALLVIARIIFVALHSQTAPPLGQTWTRTQRYLVPTLVSVVSISFYSFFAFPGLTSLLHLSSLHIPILNSVLSFSTGSKLGVFAGRDGGTWIPQYYFHRETFSKGEFTTFRISG